MKGVDEVKIITNLPVFGTVLGSNEHGKRNIIDQWIDSWFAHDKKSENNELLLTRISHEVAMLAGQKDKRNLLVACSESDLNGTVFTVKLKVDFDINRENFGSLEDYHEAI